MGPTIRPFKKYLGTDVRQRTPEPQTAKALRKDVDERINTSKTLPDKFKLENLYDALRAEIEAKLLEKGYKAYSHIAALASIKNVVSEEELYYLNQLREQRNNSRYYGAHIEETDAQVAEIRIPKIIKRIRSKNINPQAF